jgi:chemotaxis protein histidine kinase CheA
MSTALKQVLINAIVKVAGQNPARDIPGEPTAEQARDSFIQLLIAELFPENPSVPVIKARGKPGPKPKLDENGNPIRKAKSPKTVSPDSLATSSPKERKPRAPMSDEAKAAMAAKRKATLEAKKAAEPTKTPEKEVKSPKTPKAPKKAKKAEEEPAKSPAKKEAEKPKKEKAKKEKAEESPKKTPKKEKAKKEKAEESPKKEAKAEKEKKPKSPKKAEATVNLDKFLPTQKKKVKEIVGEAVDVKDVLSYLNGLSNAAFNDKPLLDHVRDYAASLKPAEEETQTEEVELVEQEFDGETYYVNPETKRVYTMDENDNPTPVGYVGMAKFEAMELEEDDE